MNFASLRLTVRASLAAFLLPMLALAQGAGNGFGAAPGGSPGAMPGSPGPSGPMDLMQSSSAEGSHYKIVDSNYKILPSDILSITVFQEEDLKSLLRVSSEGDIVFPLIGAVSVKGLSPREAADTLARKLSQGYLINPQVSITVMEFSKHSFTVLGQVQKPGSYDIPDEQAVTLLQAIGIAGGYTRIADSRKVTLMRKVEGKELVLNFNARKLASGKGDTAFAVLPGDVITVAESLF
ncbi:MAG TPA: polysaccharide biosynthesis/export family protein [Opitutaceae bacterium]|jgi:polysaccharide export outer membrane protein|nr:polysaccharide biosynthesis/export family protein [Opitutaceae bacterium]